MTQNNEGQAEKRSEQGQTDENTGTGDKAEIPESVRQATAAADSLKRENDRLEKNLKSLREENARNYLSGKSEVGTEEKKEVSPRDYAKEVIRTGKL